MVLVRLPNSDNLTAPWHLPARLLDHYLKLTRMGSCRIPLRVCFRRKLEIGAELLALG
jgi:hypothetical protein